MNLQCALQHPQAFRFPANYIYKDEWESAGGRITELPTGHLVFYGRHGRRVLMVDPEGYPLHECVWQERPAGLPVLLSARLRLDWEQWVGIKPEGLVNTMSLDLTRRPGWERITRDDLRHMASRSMNSDLETMRFFYRDEDLELHDNGLATIRHVKDAFYVLKNGSFEDCQFMSCMSRMQWARIDYLPVVELFLSLLPGTGSATFELIRGLYDDQHSHAPLPLRYRGIPVYPSEGAFRLFSAFFTPTSQTTESAREIFLNPDRSQEVQWNPSPHYPVRYLDEDQRVSVTVQNHRLQKVTCWDDSAGLPYFSIPESGQPASDGRGALVKNQDLVCYDGHRISSLRARPSWQVVQPVRLPQWQPPHSSWRDCYPEGPPTLTPAQAFSTALLYPDKQEEIGEKESQPFVFDFLDDFFEAHVEIMKRRQEADRILLSHCEAALGSCLKWDRPQQYTLWYRWPEFSQKYAQQVWNTLNRGNRLAWLRNIQFLEFHEGRLDEQHSAVDFVYLWIPFSDYSHSIRVEQWTKFLAAHLVPGGMGCIAGPTGLGEIIQRHHFHVVHAEQGEFLPTFRIHQTILPYGRLNPELTVWIIERF
jgi:hypothetical protein